MGQMSRLLELRQKLKRHGLKEIEHTIQMQEHVFSIGGEFYLRQQDLEKTHWFKMSDGNWARIEEDELRIELGLWFKEKHPVKS